MEYNSTQIQFLPTFGQNGPLGVIDVDANVQFTINFAVGDIKDPFSKKGNKSYKFTILGSKEINRLLNNYYDINVVDGTYNMNHKQKVAVIRNGVIFLDNAYMQLLAVNKISENSVYSDQSISYDVEVGNDTTSFFTDITNKYLSDLDFTDMNHTYDTTNVVASFPYNGVRDNALGTGGYKYCLPWIPAATNKYLLEDCRPAISVYEYWNRIHQSAGYQWEWNGFDTDKFRMDRLFIPYNGDKPKMPNQAANIVAAELLTPYTLTDPPPFTGSIPSIGADQFICDIEIQDFLGDYNPVTGEYTSGIYTGAVGSINVTFEVDYEFSLDNPSAGTAYLSRPIGPPATDKWWRWRPYAVMANLAYPTYDPLYLSDRAYYNEVTLYSGPSGVATLAPGMNLMSSGVAVSETIAVPGVNFGDTLISLMGLWNLASSSGAITFLDAPTGSSTVILITPYLKINSVKMIISPNINTYGYGTNINLNDFIPLKIKQSDFIKSIANMYNLVIDIDPDNDKKIVYTQRDDYYDSGTEYDWTDKLVTDKNAAIEFISNSNNKKIILTYKADTDLTNTQYLADTKEIYGQVEYELQNENIKGLDSKELIFSPTPIASTDFGTYAPIWNPQAPKCNIRILLDGGEQPTTAPYDIIDYMIGTTPVSDAGFALSTYPMLSHMDNPNTPAFDINYGLCDYYLFDFTSQTNNNLYSMFWSRTIGQIDNGKLMTAYFYLNEYDISVMKLNDKIFIKDTWYNINSLQYDPNSTGPVKAQLMTIDDGLRINVTKSRPAVGYALAASSLEMFSGVTTVATAFSNINLSPSTLVYGTGNVISESVKNSIVVGDNRRVQESNTMYTENLDITGNIVIGDKTYSADTFVDALGTWARVGDDIQATVNPDTLVDPMILPSADNACDLGTDPTRWRNLYLTNAIYFFDEVTIGNRTGSAGTGSVLLGGSTITPNTASGDYSFVTGDNNIAAGTYAFAAGQDSQVSGLHAFGFGNTVIATGEKSMATGGHALANHYGEYARSSFFISGVGDAQFGTLQYGRVTSNATITELFLDGPSASQRFTLQQNQAYAVEIRALAINPTTMASAMWTGKGIIKNVAGTTSLVAAIVPTQDQADAAMVATVLTVTADTTFNSLKIEGTGIAATNIRWNVTVSYTKLS